jgi:hypothetical protein
MRLSPVMLAERRVSSLMAASDPFFNGRRQQIVAHATGLAVPQSFIRANSYSTVA